MGVGERQQLQFLRYGRPGAAVMALVAFGILDLLSPKRSLHVLLVLLLIPIATSALGLLALRRVPLGLVTRASLALDVVLLGAMVAVLDDASVLAVPYYAPIAFAALMLGPRETLAFTALGLGAALVDGLVLDASATTLVADLVVLAATGSIVAALSHEVRSTQATLARERERDAAALAIAERVRSSLQLPDVLALAVEQLGQAVGSARCRIRAVDPRSAPLYEWTREGVEPVGAPELPEATRRQLEAGVPLAVGDLRAEPDREQWALEAFGAVAMLTYPLVWQERTIGLLAFFDDRPRRWEEDALPLVERVAPQLAAALVQAEAFDRLQELTRLREELVANVSHELRTPLTATIGFLRTLEERGDLLTPEQSSAFLQTARQEAERLGLLVGDLLELARLERGSVSIASEPVDLRALLERVQQRVEPPPGRTLHLDAPEEVVAHADGNRLLQVFHNLIANGFRHGAGDVALRLEAHDGPVEIEVTDDGAGVAADQLDELFTPFARWGSDRESTGLGLAIARRIVEAHGGELRYRPAEEGRRHAFVVTLPR